VDELTESSLAPVDAPRPLYLSNRDPDDETDAAEDEGPAQLAA
jgi:hypothetical protein